MSNIDPSVSDRIASLESRVMAIETMITRAMEAARTNPIVSQLVKMLTK